MSTKSLSSYISGGIKRTTCPCVIPGEDGTSNHNKSSGKILYNYPDVKFAEIEAKLDHTDLRYSLDLHVTPCMNHLNNYLRSGWGERVEEQKLETIERKLDRIKSEWKAKQ
jgi:hypothetical protein